VAGIVTDLSRQKKRPDRVNIFVDGQFLLGVHERLAVDLAVGDSLSDSQIETLRSAEDGKKATDNVVSLIARRPRSVVEVRRHLRKKGYSDEVVELAIDQLTERGLLDDLSFAEYWIEQRREFSPRSRFALHSELSSKGVDRQIIEQALRQIDDAEMARLFMARRRQFADGAQSPELRRKAENLLKNRGFNYSVISEIIAELNSEDSDSRSPAAAD